MINNMFKPLDAHEVIPGALATIQKVSNKLAWSLKAERTWNRTQPLAESLGAVYLLGRGCCVPECDDLRFLPASKAFPFPALVARITDALTGKPLNLQFTSLASDGCGKAPVEKPRNFLKDHRKRGGVIRLVDDAEVTMGLGLTEGTETALSVMASGWRPVWAAIDAGNLAGFPVLAGIESLTIFADHDLAGLAAADKCAMRWKEAGRQCQVVVPQTKGDDWND